MGEKSNRKGEGGEVTRWRRPVRQKGLMWHLNDHWNGAAFLLETVKAGLRNCSDCMCAILLRTDAHPPCSGSRQQAVDVGGRAVSLSSGFVEQADSCSGANAALFTARPEPRPHIRTHSNARSRKRNEGKREQQSDKGKAQCLLKLLGLVNIWGIPGLEWHQAGRKGTWHVVESPSNETAASPCHYPRHVAWLDAGEQAAPRSLRNGSSWNSMRRFGKRLWMWQQIKTKIHFEIQRWEKKRSQMPTVRQSPRMTLCARVRVLCTRHPRHIQLHVTGLHENEMTLPDTVCSINLEFLEQ